MCLFPFWNMSSVKAGPGTVSVTTSAALSSSTQIYNKYRTSIFPLPFFVFKPIFMFVNTLVSLAHIWGATSSQLTRFWHICGEELHAHCRCPRFSPVILSKCGSWTSRISITWKLVRNANIWAPSQTYWIRNSRVGAWRSMVNKSSKWS